MVDDRLDAALRAAREYYLEGRSMEAIAADLHTSRSTVSRLLDVARRRGLIEFRLHDPEEATPRLERQISQRFDIEAHLVTATGREVTQLQTLERVATAAARAVTGMLGSDMTLVLAWGTTTAAVSRHLVAKPTRNTRVVQLNGAGNSRSTGIEYASEILRRFGGAFDASVEHFPVPTFFDSAATKAALWRERSIRRVLELQGSADLALFGIGAVGGHVPSHVYSGGYLEDAEIAELAADGVVADVATVFLREDGSYGDIPLNRRSSGPDLSDLARIDQRLCVVSGLHRLPGLRGALAAGLITHLILDEETGVALVEDDPGRTSGGDGY